VPNKPLAKVVPVGSKVRKKEGKVSYYSLNLKGPGNKKVGRKFLEVSRNSWGRF
jgi:hypothetical protein